MRRIAIAIPSYRRPDRLKACLGGVERAIAELSATSERDDVEIVVIDNDPDGSAAGATAGRPVRYVHEPSPGLAAVRNRALDEAANADLLVFIDDDEVPEPSWLRELVAAFDRHDDAHGVAGRVVTPLPDGLDPWLVAVGAFVRPVRIDGQLMPTAATNNLLLELDAVRAAGLRFDPRFGMTGGEDSMFTQQFSRAGYRIRWAEAAVVVENVIPERIDRRWILMRAYRTGNSSARLRIALARGPLGRLAARAGSVASGAARVVAGSGLWAFGGVTGSLTRRARGRRAISRGSGYLSGAVGSSFREYGR